MNEFIHFRDSVASKIDIQLSTFGLACQCDYVVCNRFFGAFPMWNINEECLANVPHGGRIFLNCVDFNYWRYKDILHRVFSAYPEKKYVFYIMIEPEGGIRDILINICKYSCEFYVNCNVIDDPRVHNMPIGIRDGEEVFGLHRGFSQKMLLNAEKYIGSARNILCLLCFSYTHEERQRCYQMLADKHFVVDLNKDSNKFETKQNVLLGRVPVEYNYEMTANAVYTLSPRGCGEATHRFFEIIYLGSIPIVKRTGYVFDKLYDVYPCLVVDDWDKVSEELLNENKCALQERMVAFKARFPGWFQDPATIREMMALM